jgi:hypothetical protein
MANPLGRRKFFASALLATPLAKVLGAGALSPEILEDSRTQAALDLRKESAFDQSRRPIAPMKANGDEDSLPNRIACFAKGLPQDRFGTVEESAYGALLAAIKSGKYACAYPFSSTRYNCL